MAKEEIAKNGYNSVDKDEKKYEEETKEYGWGYRHLQTILVFQIVAVSYIMRANVSVAIIAMTDTTSNMTNIEVYDWDKKTQDFVLSSFFWGYMTMQIPSGQLAQRFGAKKLLVGAMAINGVVSLFFHNFVHWGGWQAACALRTLQGVTQSCLMPSVQVFLSKWAPITERSRLGNIVMSGASFGTIISMPSVGFLSGRFGWPVSFQAIGVLALCTGLLWAWLGSDRPSLHPKISTEERDYIETSLGHSDGHKVMKTPWKAMFTSVPFLALLTNQIGCNWGYLTMLLETPSYLKLVLKISSEMSGVYSALPYLAMFLSGYVIGYVADLLINKKIISISTARKGANTIACLGLGLGTILLSFIPIENVMLSLFILVISIGTCAGLGCGIMLAHVDLAPNFAGTLMGITNTAANALGIFAPITVGYILVDPNDIVQWRLVFILICVIMNTTNLIFIFFGTSIPQPWNQPESKDIEMTTKTREENTVEELLKK